MPKQVTVTLGGKQYTVSALPIAKAKAWRENLAVPFGTLVQTLTSANTVEINQFNEIAGLVQNFSGVLLGSVDLMLDLLFEYAEELRADKEWILQNAYDEEALGAFAEVLKLAFPFGVMLEVVTGRTASKTSSSLLSQNGVSGLPASGPKRKSKTI
jgi:hypothetical protein